MKFYSGYVNWKYRLSIIEILNQYLFIKVWVGRGLIDKPSFHKVWCYLVHAPDCLYYSFFIYYSSTYSEMLRLLISWILFFMRPTCIFLYYAKYIFNLLSDTIKYTRCVSFEEKEIYLKVCLICCPLDKDKLRNLILYQKILIWFRTLFG